MTDEQIVDASYAGYSISYKDGIISLESDKAIIEYEFNRFWLYEKMVDGGYEYIDQFDHYVDAIDQAKVL